MATNLQSVSYGYTDFVNTLVRWQVSNALTAYAGGGQTNALQLYSIINLVSTVATAGDSVMLPPTLPANGLATSRPTDGLIIIIINNGANNMGVYAAPTETINGGTSSTGVTQGPGTVCIYVCDVAGDWRVQTSTLINSGQAAVLSSITASVTPFPITGLAGSTSAGGSITVTGGAGNGAYNGGAVSLTGGASGAGATGAGAAVIVTGGAALSTNGAGGAAQITGGAGAGTGNGGAITITSGAAGATGVAGAVNIAPGAATAGAGAVTTISGGNGAGGTAAGGDVNLVPGTAVSTGTPGKVKINNNAILSLVSIPLTASSATQWGFTAPRAGRLESVSSIFTTASSSGTLQISKDTGTAAVGTGTTLLTGTVALSGSANTVSNGTLIATVASLTFAAGDRISLVIAGTMTSLAGCNVTLGVSWA